MRSPSDEPVFGSIRNLGHKLRGGKRLGIFNTRIDFLSSQNKQLGLVLSVDVNMYTKEFSLNYEGFS